MRRHLIVNADDFGLCPEVNAGVVEAFDAGIVTSASLMVRWPAAEAASALAASRPGLSLGLHVDLGEWEYVAGEWVQRNVVVDQGDRDAVAAEVASQLDEFVRLTGVTPTHLDGHQHVQREQPALGVLRSATTELGVPLRLQSPDITYRGDFYGQGSRGEPYPDGITVAQLCSVIASLPPGWTELGCHPGRNVTSAISTYASEREREVLALCDERVRDTVRTSGVTLSSFADFRTCSPPG